MKPMMKTFALVGTMAAVSAVTAVGTVRLMDRNNDIDLTSQIHSDGHDLATRVGYFPTVRTGSVTDNDFTVAAEKTVNAVVGITNKQMRQQRQYYGGSTGDPLFDFFFGQRGQQQQQPQQPQGPVPAGSGSGVIISADGYIVTNNHVINNADELTVTLNDGREFTATLVGTDPTTDIALIKIDAKALPTIEFGESDALKVGEWVLAVGNPFNLTSTVTAGIVSAKGRALGGQRGRQLGIESFIQTDAAVNPGNSGGALVNTSGQLVGINTAIYSETGNYAGYSFAVPSSIVSKVVTDLRQYGTVQRAMLGITGGTATAELAEKEGKDFVEGVWVSETAEKGAAAEAGIQKGDVIVGIGDATIKTMAQLQEQVARFRPGEKASVTYVRDGKRKSVNVTFLNTKGSTEVIEKTSVDKLGCTFKNLSADELRRYGVRSGVQVSKVEQGGLMARAGIGQNFLIVKVNDQIVKSEKDIQDIVKSLTSNRAADQDPVMFIVGVYPNGRTAYYAVDLSK